MPKVKKHTAEDCFQIYVSLGEERTIERVAEITQKSPKTIYNYSYQGKWKERLTTLKEEDKSIIEAFVRDSKHAKALLESEVYKSVSAKLLQTLEQSMEMLEPSGNPRDIKVILDTYRLINGQPTDISRQEVSTVNTDALTDEELEQVGEDLIRKMFGESAEA
ncbi:hypothetical protein [Deinococcus ficus]|uniref:hypothetical protein n=1 Tax=Deinococcus ficus TaxID=317577 RepID=UPI001F22CE9A|nr:hypothetical protein [Deinococcus ficus]